MTALLSVDAVGKRFGGLTALENVSFELDAGCIVGIMGANGAGKTTLFSLIAGNARPSTGDIRFAGQSLVGLRPDQICRMGVARTFQIVKPFPALTVLENLRTAGMFGKAGLRTARRPSSTLTLAGQKRLEVARAIATGAQLILLDEVMAGLTPVEVAAMLDTLRRVRASRGLTLLVIEHVMRALMELCSRIVLLHHGRLIAQGEPQEIGRNEKVLSVYFGVSGE